MKCFAFFDSYQLSLVPTVFYTRQEAIFPDGIQPLHSVVLTWLGLAIGVNWLDEPLCDDDNDHTDSER